MAHPAFSRGQSNLPQSGLPSRFSQLLAQISVYSEDANGSNDDKVDEDKVDEYKIDFWQLMPEVKSYRQRIQEARAARLRGRKLGVTWTNLTVKGTGASAAFRENIVSQFNIPQQIKEARHQGQLKTILEDSHGCVKPGEMLLVLGRPGSGCTTLLKMLSNRRQGYAEIDGTVFFGSMTPKESEQYKGQIVMNTEEDIFFPTLTVGQTIDFATRLKVPFHLPSDTATAAEFQHKYRTYLLNMLGISHTEDTMVGDEFIRGVSGGERKRLSIIECLATRGSIFCWDNSTRGLDASGALQFIKAIRAMTDILGLASVVTIYQAGNGIYQLFDKVLVLDEGKQMFYGPIAQARPFMESLGFICDESANVADFLTGITSPTERQIREGYECRFPRNADEVRKAYCMSTTKADMEKEFIYPFTSTAKRYTDEFKEEIGYDKHKSLPEKSPLTASFVTQVKSCVTRQYQILWGDKPSLIIKQTATLIQALLAGSLFYNAPDNSSGLFLKSGAMFVTLVCHSLIAMSEVTDSFTARPVLAQHKKFAFLQPAAFSIAQIFTDIPVLLFQVTHFSLVVYFMVGLKLDAAAFFTYWIVIFAASMCMTAIFRAIGATFGTFDGASKVSGLLTSALLIYNGYMIPKTQMHPWFSWIYWINPLAYAFEALLGNEFNGTIIKCVANNLVPNGPGYANAAYQSCAGVRGATQGATYLTGQQYLSSLSYSHAHLWRNFGIIWGFWAFAMGVTIIATSRWKAASSTRGSLLIPREHAKHNQRLLRADEESQIEEKGTKRSSATLQDASAQLIRNTSVFTWKDLTYTVKTSSGDRVLLDKVSGWVKPGMLGALMGCSGAGKTTLLDVLAQRKTEGTIRGSILVDGRPLPISFQRSAGYCEQFDVHEPLATVREALEFSALLRQSRDIPKEDKLKYVDTIIELLELQDIEHTLIGKVGAGLTVEQRKRLTIGVELVSKPSILIFLDEPTSGLDGQAAFNILLFLKKLAAAGQAILVTIHQPSASLFSQFDTLLLLAKGGRTVYFGDIGDGADTVKEYFARYGAPCPDDVNPAEHMIDVVSGPMSQGKDWCRVWLDSPEHSRMTDELEYIINEAAAKEPGTKDDGFEFAMPLWAQIKVVTWRMTLSLFRDTDYVNNKFLLHIGSALFNGFSFWKIGDTVQSLQFRLFTIFNFFFVAPGVIGQLQPLFIARRDIYDAREKKSRIYSWKAFVTALIVSEIPYLCICAVLYFVCWYYTVGFPKASDKAGGSFFVVLFYEFIYTGIGQAIAAYAPNAVFAALVNPVIIIFLVGFCGVLIPYAQIQAFWRYWMYYLNPFTYLMGSLLTFTTFDATVNCAGDEFALFDPPGNQTCGAYLAEYKAGVGARTKLINPDATSGCRVCEFRRGSDYLAALNLGEYYDGWRDAGIVVIFAITSYMMVYLFMKLRTKTSKKAE